MHRSSSSDVNLPSPSPQEPSETPRGAQDPPPPRRDTRRYWRSLDRLLDSPAVREELASRPAASPEFPAGADQPPGAVDRRTMMTLMGASFAMAGLQGCRRPVEKILPYVNAPETIIPGVPRHYATTMPLGTDALGLLVESHEGRPTKIEGNELHPSSGGAASAWAQASILNFYDPDRSPHVRRRASFEAAADGHGATIPAFQTVSAWEEFEAFWQGRSEALGDGAGLAVLSGGYASPTLARLRAAFEARFPAARWVVSEPAGDANVFAGVERVTGGAYRPVYHVGNARVILALDADFLCTESESVRNARGFAHGRRVEPSTDGVSRLYAAESTMTATGAAADHRLRMKRAEVAGFAAAVARELGLGVEGGAVPAGAEEKFRAVVDDLKAAGTAALVLAGRAQPPAVHALALAINQALGAMGTTVALHEARDVGYGGPDALADLAAEIEAGRVDTLVMLGGNPVYDAPGDVDFASALGKVAHSVHLSLFFDETSRLAEWHLPATHFLEAWGDARTADGTLSVVQPLIAPLFGGRSELEIVHLLTSGAHTPGYELVRETWRGTIEGDFEKGWRRVLHDGLLRDRAGDPAAGNPAAGDPAAGDPAAGVTAAGVTADDLSGISIEAPRDGLEVTFHLSSDVHDGRFANNAWLQELPDVMTKITWDNAALLSLATARELGLGDRLGHGEKKLKARIAKLSQGEATLEIPVFVMPGQADDSIALFLGYGRSAAGRVGDGVGFDVSRLRRAGTPWFDGGLSAERVRGHHKLVQTQEHWSMSDWDWKKDDDRALAIEGTLAEYKADHHFVHHHVHLPADSQLFEYHPYDTGYQWGMAIDLNACIGCNACIVACQSENNIPVVGKDEVARGREMHWLRLDRYFVHGSRDVAQAAADPAVAFQPIPCMHCENAPCEQVCPVAATVHDAEGINAMVYNRCIGTRYCSNNCPYKVRRFNFFNFTKDTPEIVKMAQNPDVTVRSRGVMEKCTYCLQRLSEGKITAKKEGRELRDGEAKTACQETCPTEAIAFGNIRDEGSRVFEEKAKDRNYVILGELNNRPRTSYLARIRNPNPDWPGASAAEPHGESEA